MMKFNGLAIRILRLTWLITAVMTVAIILILAPGTIRNAQDEPLITTSAEIFGQNYPVEILSAVIVTFRFAALSIFIFTSVWLFLFRPERGIVLLCSLSLLLLPFLLNLAGTVWLFEYPSPIASILPIAIPVLIIVGIITLILFAYLFPDGQFKPHWIKYMIAFLLPLATIVNILPSLGFRRGYILPTMFLIYLVIALIAIASQVYRHMRLSNSAEKRQIRWVTFSISALITSLIGVIVLRNFQDEPGLAFFQLLLLILIPVLLPLSILFSIRKHQLWDINFAPYRRFITYSLAVVWTIPLIIGICLSVQYFRLPTRLAGLKNLPPRTIIVDTDMASDDLIALLFLFQHPSIKIMGITVTGTGEAHCEAGVRNALSLLDLAEVEEIPVACGRETPLSGNHAFPAEWRENVDRLYDLKVPDSERTPSNQTATELLLDIIQKSPEKVTILALGPLTNLAEVLQADTGLSEKISMIYIMGGAVKVPGNISASGVGIDNPFAEWNIYADPRAANIVFQSNAPITLVPLDATTHTLVRQSFFRKIQLTHPTPEAHFVYRLLSSRYSFIKSGGYYFWDPLAAAILTSESLADINTYPLEVIETEGPESGRTRLNESGPPVRVAVSADRWLFENYFL